jgi:hypothetical protein
VFTSVANIPLVSQETRGRRGRFAVARLIEKYADTPMPDLLPELTKYPKWEVQSALWWAGGDRMVSPSR